MTAPSSALAALEVVGAQILVPSELARLREEKDRAWEQNEEMMFRYFHARFLLERFLHIQSASERGLPPGVAEEEFSNLAEEVREHCAS
jgi:hypothetical protein